MFLRILLISSLSIVLLLPGRLSPASLADGPTVVINELQWMGSSVSSADEWIELRNTTDHEIDLSGWQLTKRSSGQDVAMITLPATSTISAGGFFVISNYANTSTSSTLNIVPQYVTSDVALSNTSLQIKLFDATHALIDVADDGLGNPLAGMYDSSKKLYATMERNPIPGDGTSSLAWHSASQSVGYKSNPVELGTPGSANSNGRPIANAGPNQTGVVGQPLNFDASDSFDPEGVPLIFAWAFGDGATSSEAAPSHVYAAAGAYTVTLSVSDGIDQSSDTLTVTISDAPAAATTDDTPTTPADVAPKTSCHGLRLSEVLPNPAGVDDGEFVELQNVGDEDVPVEGCVVWTSTTRKYVIHDSAVVARQGFFVVPKSVSKLTLNNGGATIRLVDTDASELDRVTYGKALDDQSWSRFGADWRWTTKVTAGGANVLVVPPVKTTTTSAASSASKKTAPPAVNVTLAAVQELDSGDRVALRGTVISPRDALGSTLVTIQSDDGGVVISVPNGEVTVQLGDVVTLTGTVRLKQGRRYVSTEAHSLAVVGHNNVAVPSITPTDDIGVEQADQLVHVRGVIGLASGSTIQIDDGSGPLNVYLKSSTGIVRPKMKAGDTVDVVGVVNVTTSGVRVLPRMQSDLRVEQVLGASTMSTQTVVAPPAASKTQTLWYWSVVGLGLIAASIKPLWSWRKKRQVSLD